jgi:hypothetical protein
MQVRRSGGGEEREEREERGERRKGRVEALEEILAVEKCVE